MKYRFSAAVEGGPANLEFTLEPLGGDRYRYERNGRVLELTANRLPGRGSYATWLVTRPGRTDLCDVTPGETSSVEVAGHSLQLQVSTRRRVDAAAGKGRGAAGPSEIKSPMPGKVVKILVNPGETVVAGQGVIVVEAMKMENELRASRGGAVDTVLVKEGQAVDAGQVMLRLAAPAPAAE